MEIKDKEDVKEKKNKNVGIKGIKNTRSKQLSDSIKKLILRRVRKIKMKLTYNTTWELTRRISAITFGRSRNLFHRARHK